MTRKEEIKQASKKYFDDYLDGLKGEVLTVDQTFEDAAKWADETMIKKACEWLNMNIIDYITEGSREGISLENQKQLIDDFRKAMEE